MGISTDPYVSAAQWTNPDTKSAVNTPQTRGKYNTYVETMFAEHKFRVFYSNWTHRFQELD